MAGILHGKDEFGHGSFVDLVCQQDFRDAVLDIAVWRDMVAVSIVLGIAGNDRRKVFFDELIVDFDLHGSCLVGQKIIDDPGVVAHGTGDEAVVDEVVIVGDIGIDAKAGDVDKVTVVDADDIDIMKAVGKIVSAIMIEIISGALRDKGKDILGADQVVEQ